MTQVYKDVEINIGAKKEYFSWLPNCIIYEWGLSAEALAAALYLNGKPAGWQTRPFDIRKHFGWGDHKWRKVSRELKDHDLLQEEITQQGTKLWFRLPEMKLSITKSAPVDFRGPRIGASRKSTALDNKDHTKKDLLNKKDFIEHLNEKSEDENQLVSVKDEILPAKKPAAKPRISQDEVEQVFNQLWQMYPLKKGKQKALQALIKILKGKTKEEAEKLAKEIWSGLTAHITEHQTKHTLKSQGADIWIPELPHLSTWFNQARWKDDYQQPQDILNFAKRRPGVLDLDAIFM